MRRFFLLLAACLGIAAASPAQEPVLGDGVNLFNGRKTEAISDITLPLRGGMTLEWKRSYVNDGRVGALGVGWDSSLFEMSLQRVEASDCPMSSAPDPEANDLVVQPGPIKDPCPNEPTVSREATLCRPGGADYFYVFSQCRWTRQPRQTAGVRLRQAGRPEAFYAGSGGVYSTPPGRTEQLSEVSGGWELTAQDGTAWAFDGQGVLTGWRDRNNNSVSLTQVTLSGGRWRVDVTGPGGRALKVTFSDRKLVESVEDPLGHEHRYFYDSVSRLVRVEGPGPDRDDGSGYVATYGYDALGRMTEKDDAKSAGFKKASYSYASTGQVSEVRDGLGRVRERYDWGNAGQVTLTRGRGQKHVFQLDSQGKVVKMTDPAGRVDERVYDKAGNLVERRLKPTDASAPRVMTWSYDSYRNVTRAVDAEGHEETWVYASVIAGCGCDRFATSHTDKRGFSSTRSFDSAGNLTATTDAAGKTTLYGYDAQGQRSSATQPRGGQTTYEYNAQGDLTAVRGPAGDVAYEVDALGRVTAVTDELGRRTAYRLDGFGNALRTTYADNSFVNSEYNAHGLLTRQSLQTAQGQSALGWTQYSFDAADQLESMTDAEGGQTLYGYDADGNRETLTDPNGALSRSAYDPLGRLSGQQDPLGNHTLYKLDAYGNRGEVVDANGQRTRYSYDKLDRLRFITDAEGHTIEFRYDQAGNRRFMVDSRGKQTEWRYDSRGLLTHEIDAKGVTVKHYTYDDDGNVATLTDGNGTVTTYAYDLAGRLLSETPSVGSGYAYTYGAPSQPNKGYNLHTVTDPRGVESFLYDDLDRLETHSKPTGEVLAHDYDVRGNRTRTDLTFRSGAGINPAYQTWTYDKLNRNTQARDVAGLPKKLAYDPASRLLREDLPGRVRTEYQYDAANRLLDLRNLDGAGSLLARSKYRLDSVGNRLSKQTVDGREEYSYDKTYQLTGVKTDWADLEVQAQSDPKLKLQSGVTKTVSISYDPMGNRTNYQEAYTGGVPSLSKSYSHNDANEMLSDGGVVQTYDDNGNLTGKGSETLAWDHRNRLIGVNTPGQDPWSAGYDYNNRIHSRAVAAQGVDFIYDDLGRLWAEVDPATGRPKKVYSHDAIGLIGEAEVLPSGRLNPSYFLYDGLGSVVAITDKKSNVLHNFSYGAFGDGGRAQSFGYTGRWGGYADERVGVLNWHRWYGPAAGRWGSRDPIGIQGGNNLYGYVLNSTVNKIDSFGLYASDCLNPQDCIRRVADQASDDAEKSGLAGLHNGPADAYRHCLGMCEATKQCSLPIAWLAGTGYEYKNGSQPRDERVMDLHNNAVGRNFGKRGVKSCDLACRSALSLGLLKTLPRKQWSN